MPLLTECFTTHFTGVRVLTTQVSEWPITYFTCTWTLTPVYITGMSAFSTVYMKLFIQSVLVKTQRLDIRIYSDRKINYFVNYVYIYIYNKNSLHLKKLCYLQQCTRWLTMFCIISLYALFWFIKTTNRVVVHM